jgi:hypothetical protein
VETQAQKRALEDAGWLLCDGALLGKEDVKFKALAEAIAPSWDKGSVEGKLAL